MSDTVCKTQMLHLLKATQFRFSVVNDGAPENFGDFDPGGGVKTPTGVLSHINDVLTFAAMQFEPDFTSTMDKDWASQVKRLEICLANLHRILRESDVDEEMALRLTQGPLADVLTHVGQLAMMRRMAGAPVPGTNYFLADIPDIVEGTA